MITSLLTLGLLSAPAFDKIDLTINSVVAIEALYDAANTRYALSHSALTEWDLLLGAHPGKLRIWAFTVGGQVAFWSIARILPNPWRKLFEIGTELIETGIIVSNMNNAHVFVGKIEF